MTPSPDQGTGAGPGAPGGPTAPGTPDDQAHAPVVLVVDDEEGVRTTVAAILRSAGYRVLEAQDGRAALSLLDHDQPEVMVLDVQMPRVDGIEVLEELADPPTTILMSARALDPEVHGRVRLKVFTLLKKPFRPERLVDAVAAALGEQGDG